MSRGYGYWPCVDAAGSVQASNYAPGNRNPLVVTTSKYGVANGTQAFGQNSQALLGAQGTFLISSSVRVQTQAGMWGTTTGSGSTFQGWSLACTDTEFPPVSNGVTVEFWFQPISPFTTGLDNVVSAATAASQSQWVWLLYLNHVTGLLTLDTQGSSATPTSVTLSATDYLTGTPPLTHVALAITSTTYTAYVDGVQQASGSWGGAIPNFDSVYFGGTAGTTFSQGYWSGYLGHVAVFPSLLSGARIMTHYQAGIDAMTGDSPDARIERLLQAGSYSGKRVILQDAGAAVTPCASCQDIAGSSAAGSIQNIASSTVPAVLGVAPGGELFYLARGYVYNQAVRWTLGENAGSGEIPYLDDIGFGWDPLRVINDVQITQLDNQDVVTPSATVQAIDQASQQQYGDQPYWVTGYLENDLLSGYAAGPGLLDLADWIGSTNAKPGLRVAQVTVDAARNPAAWPLFMQACKGDLVTVNRRPITSPGTVLSVTGRISQTTRNLQWSLDGCAGTISLLIDIAPDESVLTADDPVRGQLNGTNALAW